jgi:glycerol kinase
MELEYLTAREPFSALSCAVTARLVVMAKELDGATRAALEAQAYQTRDLIAAMASDTGLPLSLMRVDGGLVANQFVCQFLADILQTPIDVPIVTEATAWGAASLAGLGVGLFSDLDEMAQQWQMQHRYSVQMANKEANTLYAGWQQAVQSLLGEKIDA